MHKIGSVPFKVYENKVAVLFVTSQARGRWILPKGTLNDGESHEDACYRETFNAVSYTHLTLPTIYSV